MTSERRFIDEVDELPETDGRPHHHQTHPPENVSLATAKFRKTNILTPTYVPAGYVLSQVNLSHDAMMAMLVYSNEARERHQYRDLVIMQGGSLSPQGFSVKRGHAEAVELQSGSNAHMVRGGWAPADPYDESSALSWDSEVATTLFFERSEGLILLRGEPASAWPASELQRVAASLQTS